LDQELLMAGPLVVENVDPRIHRSWLVVVLGPDPDFVMEMR
jgi:hypothetical protein